MWLTWPRGLGGAGRPGMVVAGSGLRAGLCGAGERLIPRLPGLPGRVRGS